MYIFLKSVCVCGVKALKLLTEVPGFDAWAAPYASFFLIQTMGDSSDDSSNCITERPGFEFLSSGFSPFQLWLFCAFEEQISS